MTGNGLPWIQFWVDDWMSSATVKMMTLEERTVYIELIFRQWQLKSLPDNTKMLARLISLDHEEFKKHWKVVSKQFEIINENGALKGQLVNKKCWDVRQKAEASVYRNHKAAIKGAMARWKK